MLKNTFDWSASPIFSNEYLVSDTGLVFSIRSGKVLKPNKDKCGYLHYVLCVHGERKTVKAHRLVALAFLPNPDQKPAIDHINGIKTDNRVENLRWATNAENSRNPITLTKLQANATLNYKKMMEANAKRGFGRKPVTVIYQNGIIDEFQSLSAAAHFLGENYSKLSERINGIRPQKKEYMVVWAQNGLD